MTTPKAQQPPCSICGVDACVGTEYGRRWYCWSCWLQSADRQQWLNERAKEILDADDMD